MEKIKSIKHKLLLDELTFKGQLSRISCENILFILSATILLRQNTMFTRTKIAPKYRRLVTPFSVLTMKFWFFPFSFFFAFPLFVPSSFIGFGSKSSVLYPAQQGVFRFVFAPLRQFIFFFSALLSFALLMRSAKTYPHSFWNQVAPGRGAFSCWPNQFFRFSCAC